MRAKGCGNTRAYTCEDMIGHTHVGTRHDARMRGSGALVCVGQLTHRSHSDAHQIFVGWSDARNFGRSLIVLTVSCVYVSARALRYHMLCISLRSARDG